MDFSSRLTSRSHNYMLEGDLVIVYERHDSMDHLYLKHGDVLNNKHGAFHHDDFIGKPFGSRVASRSSSGWIMALKPTPELWGLAVHSRTQIVDEVDSAVVVSRLNIQPGWTVVESGTGSGCMTLCLARAIYPSGHVYSFEYNEVRANDAREEFHKFGLSDAITVQCRNVCAADGNGGFSGVGSKMADAVFLDLPEPWLAVPHVLACLKGGRTLCSYSPCIGQVEKTCAALRDAGFHSIEMIEVRRRPFDGRLMGFEVPLMRPNPEQATGDAEATEGANQEEEEPFEENEQNSSGEGSDNEESDQKRRRVGADSNTTDAEKLSEYAKYVSLRKARGSLYPPLQKRTMAVARPIAEMKGHTAFLTFAVCPNYTDGIPAKAGGAVGNKKSQT